MSTSAEPGPARLVVTLTLAGVLSGLAIVGTYEATLPRITLNQARALQRAIFQAVPSADSYRPLRAVEEELTATETAADAEMFAVYDASGALAGYAIPGEGAGFQDTIRLLMGLDPTGRLVLGMQVLESRETPGLGDRIFKDPEFVGSFRNLSAEPEILLVKKGTSSAPNEVDGITGATISSKAVVKILNQSIDRWAPRLPDPGSETWSPPDPVAAEGA